MAISGMNAVGWNAVRQPWTAVALLGLYCVGCAGAPPPNERMSMSSAAIRAAQEVGAEHVPRSALQLKLAQEQVERGKRLMDDGDNERADLVLQRAQADAELALALAREETTRKQAQPILEKAGVTATPPPATP